MESIKPTDGEILSNVLNSLNLTANKLSVKMGYKSANSVYNIIDENHQAKITIKFAEKLVELYPQVNFLYVTQGKEPVLLNNGMSIGQSNLFNNERPSFDDIPGVLFEIRDLLKEFLGKED